MEMYPYRYPRYGRPHLKNRTVDAEQDQLTRAK